jgi:hypothetical protein
MAEPQREPASLAIRQLAPVVLRRLRDATPLVEEPAALPAGQRHAAADRPIGARLPRRASAAHRPVMSDMTQALQSRKSASDYAPRALMLLFSSLTMAALIVAFVNTFTGYDPVVWVLSFVSVALHITAMMDFLPSSSGPERATWVCVGLSGVAGVATIATFIATLH